MAKMRLENAREQEQLVRMKYLQEQGICFFCGKNYSLVNASGPIYETEWWYVKKNDFSYVGAVHHYLIVPKTHHRGFEEFIPLEMMELLDVICWLQKHLNASGMSIFVRSGNMLYTGATIDHMHFHFLVGEPDGEDTEPIKIKLGYKKSKGPVE